MPRHEHKSILLTNPEGFQSHLFEPSTSATSEAADIEHVTPADEPEAPGEPVSHEGAPGVQFDSEQIERGRSRILKHDLVRNESSGERQGSNGNADSRSHSRSRSRSMSRSRSRIREEEFLKWTVLRQDPSMRLYNVKKPRPKGGLRSKNAADAKKNRLSLGKKKAQSSEDDESDEEDSEEDDDDSESESEDEDEEESDEEQVSDIDDDAEIDAKFDYDPGMKVLPNFVVSINDVLKSSKPWIAKFEAEGGFKAAAADVQLQREDEGYIRGMRVLRKQLAPDAETPVADAAAGGAAGSTPEPSTYILYMDMSSESIYALTYVMGTVVNNGDTVYIVQWESSSKSVADTTIIKNVATLSEHCEHLFDCISAVVDTLDVVVLSLTHPYPKHLLSEMVATLKPQALCCSLSMVLGALQNFVCGVPTLVIRKKLKRTKRKGFME
ncbi:Imp21 protein [Maudiozyma humilis]|uniref:Imp21 protein n=1 Tax=Maudiozyma humilis TaxID=51915 RepID=A0AAV5RPC5_MAUHU|nr:Imp21 protein [Kazachstania humilis]